MGIRHFYGNEAKKVLLLVTYDVNTQDKEGKARLRKVAKACVDCGQRVQNSVFECSVDAGQARQLKHKLEKLIDPAKDSLRFYELGNQYHNKIEHFGTKSSYDAQGVLMI